MHVFIKVHISTYVCIPYLVRCLLQKKYWMFVRVCRLRAPVFICSFMCTSRRCLLVFCLLALFRFAFRGVSSRCFGTQMCLKCWLRIRFCCACWAPSRLSFYIAMRLIVNGAPLHYLSIFWALCGYVHACVCCWCSLVRLRLKGPWQRFAGCQRTLAGCQVTGCCHTYEYIHTSISMLL